MLSQLPKSHCNVASPKVLTRKYQELYRGFGRNGAGNKQLKMHKRYLQDFGQ